MPSRERRRRRDRARDRGQEALGLGAEARLLPILGDALDQPGRLDEGVVGDAGPRRVAAAPVHEQPERRRSLLGGGAGVEDAAAELEPVARSLVDGIVTPDCVGVRLA